MRQFVLRLRRLLGIVRPHTVERETRGLGSASRFDALLTELRFAVRTLRRAPGFVIAVTVTLALGIGANATMFGLIERLLLRVPERVRDPGRVVTAAKYERDSEGNEGVQEVLSYPIYRDLTQLPAFSHVAAISTRNLTLGRGADARQVTGALVTSAYFDLLGVRPQAGRFFSPEDDALPNGLPVMIVSHEFWTARLGGDRAVLGRGLSVGARQFTVIGIAPPDFAGHDRRPVDLWIPMSAGRSSTPGDTAWALGRQSYWLQVLARLREGVTPAVAAEQMTAALRAGAPPLAAGEELRGVLTSILPREALADSPVARSATLVAIVSVIVLLIACANVANLQLVRAIKRRREIAVRLALGMGRGRLSTQLVLESLLLALLGGAAALLVVFWGGEVMRRTLLAGMPLPGSVVSVQVLLFTSAISIGAGVLTGMAPLLEAGRSDLSHSLKQGSRGAGTRRSRTRAALLLAQAALSVLLLVGAGVFVRSLNKVSAIPLGMDASKVLVASVQTAGAAYSGVEEGALYQRLLETAQRSPDVESAALAFVLPFSSSWAERVRLPGGVRPPTTSEGGPYTNGVSPDFFRTMGTRIVRGRGFTAADDERAARVAVVNETLARLWWPGQDAIGKCFHVGNDGAPCTMVVGIAENARRQAILEPEVVHYYLPIAQYQQPRVLFLRARSNPALVQERLRRELQSAASDLPYVDVRPLSDALVRQTRSWRLGATMFGAFGALSLLLAGIGLFSVLAYDVAQRTHELGVRVALGAQPGDVLAMVVGRAVRLVAVGAAIGLLLALAAGGQVQALLYETSPHDPLVMAVVVTLVLVVGVVASAIPARRATRVDPATALRSD
jgi:putative ABC transport system permease protein